jgi:hypothetical protein
MADDILKLGINGGLVTADVANSSGTILPSLSFVIVLTSSVVVPVSISSQLEVSKRDCEVGGVCIGDGNQGLSWSGWIEA